MLDKAAILKEAQKYLAKGAIDKAIGELEKLVKDSPDGNINNMIGDIYLKKGTKKSAIENYLKAADFFRHEGFAQKAQALYKKVLNINPADVDALTAFGEICEEKNMISEATKYYLAVADLLSKEGKKDKLLDIYEKILSLAPANIPLRIKVAEIYIKEGLKSDGAKEYAKIANICNEKGEHQKAKEFFQKTLDLQPLNKEAVLGLSVVCEKTDNIKQAVEQIKEAAVLFPEDLDILMRCADLAVKSGDDDFAKKCLHRIIEKNPQSLRARKTLGELYIRAGSAELAWAQYLPMLDDILAGMSSEEAIVFLGDFRTIDRVETSKKLVGLYKLQNNDDLAIEELLSLGDLYASMGQEEDSRSFYAEAEGINPEHPEVRRRLVLAEPEPQSETEPETLAEPELDITEIEIPETFEPSVPEPEEAPSFQEPEISQVEEKPMGSYPHQESEGGLDIGLNYEADKSAVSAQPSPAAEKTFDEIITEADIFSRYGLFTEAERLLEGLKPKFPDSVDLHLRLKSVYIELQNNESAVTELIILSELYGRNGDTASAEQALKDAVNISPDDPRLAERAYKSFVQQTAYQDEMAEASTEKKLDLEDYEEELAEADFYKRQGLTSEAINILERLHRLFPDSREINDRLQSLGQTGSAIEADELSFGIDIPEDALHQDVGAETERLAESEGFGAEAAFSIPEEDESFGIPDRDSMFETLEHDQKKTEAKEKPVAESTETEIPAGADFMQEEISIAEVKSPRTEPPTEEAPETPEEEYEDFTLTDTDLVEAQEMPEPTLDNDVLDIFREFKKGLEKELGDEDSETHYNLGIAYKEMGLIEDAIKEFQTSRSDPARFIQSSTMLGVCYMEKGLYGLAIDVLKKAAEEMKDKDESYWALSYELAEAYEKNLNIQEALKLYTEVYGWNARFRSVSDKMSELRGKAKSAEGREKGTDSSGALKDKPKERKDRVSYL